MALATYDYPRPAVTVDLVAFRVADGQLELQLIRRSEAPYRDAWALPGAFVHEREPLRATAARVLSAKSALAGIHLEQLATFGDDPKRDPRGHIISVAYLAILNERASDQGRGEWFAPDALPKLAFDHRQIIDTAVERLRNEIRHTRISLAFMPATFTMTALQNTWEAVLGEPLDKRNFRKSMRQHDWLVDTGKKSTGGAHPPAALYRVRA
ncbi:MAG: NUDIX domain-containing protein [Pseudomonadota bacterium]